MQTFSGRQRDNSTGRSLEELPLINDKHDDYGNGSPEDGNKDAPLVPEEGMTLTLMITILVVTIGSSLQFGYGMLLPTFMFCGIFIFSWGNKSMQPIFYCFVFLRIVFW
jgi:hypothetical protein